MTEVLAAPTSQDRGDLRIGDVLGRTFSIIARNPVQLLLPTALFLLLQLPGDWQQVAAEAPRSLSDLKPTAPTFALQFISGFLVTLVTTFGAWEALQGRPVRLGGMVRVGLARFWPALGAAVVSYIGMLFGIALLVVPGLIIMLMWFVGLPVCIIERTRPVESLTRSQQLTRGHRWKLLGILLLTYLLPMLAGGALSEVAKAVAGRAGATGAEYVADVLIEAFGAVLAVVIYHRLRMAKEGIADERLVAVFS